MALSHDDMMSELDVSTWPTYEIFTDVHLIQYLMETEMQIVI